MGRRGFVTSLVERRPLCDKDLQLALRDQRLRCPDDAWLSEVALASTEAAGVTTFAANGNQVGQGLKRPRTGEGLEGAKRTSGRTSKHPRAEQGREKGSTNQAKLMKSKQKQTSVARPQNREQHKKTFQNLQNGHKEGSSRAKQKNQKVSPNGPTRDFVFLRISEGPDEESPPEPVRESSESAALSVDIQLFSTPDACFDENPFQPG